VSAEQVVQRVGSGVAGRDAASLAKRLTGLDASPSEVSIAFVAVMSQAERGAYCTSHFIHQSEIVLSDGGFLSLLDFYI
jgi:hypothetical protein